MVLPPLTLAQHVVLNRIASGEARDYSTIYGGRKFSGFADHPRVNVPLHNGNHSSAAGRYQLLAPTWDLERKRLALPDFSPDSQDRAAWDLAQRTYRGHTGRDLEADQLRGAVDWGVLAKQWISLKPKPEPTAQPVAPDSQHPVLTNPLELEALLHPKGNSLEPEVSELQPAPAINTGGMQLAAMQALLPQHQFQPVDYNPWKLAPHLEPIHHDPFAPPGGAPAEETAQ